MNIFTVPTTIYCGTSYDKCTYCKSLWIKASAEFSCCFFSCVFSLLFLLPPLQIRMRDDAMPLAHVAIAVEGASVGSPDIVPLMVANSIIGSYHVKSSGGKVRRTEPLVQQCGRLGHQKGV